MVELDHGSIFVIAALRAGPNFIPKLIMREMQRAVFAVGARSTRVTWEAISFALSDIISSVLIIVSRFHPSDSWCSIVTVSV